MTRTSKRRKKVPPNTSAVTGQKKAPSHSAESPENTNPDPEFEPQVFEDADETCWGFIGGVQPPKK
jgi:hypothetical protein